MSILNWFREVFKKKGLTGKSSADRPDGVGSDIVNIKREVGSLKSELGSLHSSEVDSVIELRKLDTKAASIGGLLEVYDTNVKKATKDLNAFTRDYGNLVGKEVGQGFLDFLEVQGDRSPPIKWRNFVGTPEFQNEIDFFIETQG